MSHICRADGSQEQEKPHVFIATSSSVKLTFYVWLMSMFP